MSGLGGAELNCCVSSQWSDNNATEQTAQDWTVCSPGSSGCCHSLLTAIPHPSCSSRAQVGITARLKTGRTRTGAQISEWVGYLLAANTVQHCSAEAAEETFSAGHCKSVHIFTSGSLCLSQSFPLLFSLCPLPSFLIAMLFPS